MLMDVFTTTGDRAALLAHRRHTLSALFRDNAYPTLTVDAAHTHQSMDGFGFSLTGGSAMLIAGLAPSARQDLLRELFTRDGRGIGVSFLRLTIGASDLSTKSYSYNDLPPGQTDFSLSRFDIMAGDEHVIPVLKDILSINPDIRIMASPWSAPPWMKDNGSFVGGSLKPDCYDVYARYLVRYLETMKSHGIPVHAMTLQNEPHNHKNDPSMVMTASAQADFIQNHIGPMLQKSGLNTQILCWDHNCDEPDYPVAVLSDPAVKRYVTGVAFHLYNGGPEALSQVQALHPDQKMYLTEQWVGADGNFRDDLAWHARNVFIGVMRNGGRAVLEWNLASDPACGPHTPGGEPHCVGALTIDDQSITRNVAYYLIGHAAKFIPPGSVRVESNDHDILRNAAFHTPDGRMVMMVLNDSDRNQRFNIRHGEKQATITLKAGAVSTCSWPAP